VGDDGLIDAERLAEAIADTQAEFRVAPKGRPPQPNPQQGTNTGQPQGKTTWAGVLKGQ
jgi:hypothetical protein